MADHLFIVPGYSDEDFSFVPIRNLLIEKGLYAAQNIRSIEYASLDDQVGFRDFADKLEDVYADFLNDHPDTRIDVLAHSTGSLVVRSWLYMRRLRQKRQNSIDPGIKIDCPVDHLFLFAPANFGSDLARLGRSGLNATLVTFTKTVKQSATLAGNRDLFETGKRVLEGLEPASPTQWELSLGDLHQETYFGEHDVSGQHCFPFIFAAGKFETSLRSTFVRNLQKDGTDSTVRIAGTSLNTRLFTLRSSRQAKNSFCEVNVDNELIPGTMNRRKYGDIAFAIFGDYDHCGIINDNGNCKKGKHEDDASWRNSTCLPNQWGPLELLKKAKQVTTPTEYESAAKDFAKVRDDYINPKRTKDDEGIFQQFFFRVIDDTDQGIRDFHIQFLISDAATATVDEAKTAEFADLFGDKSSFHSHSIDNSHAVLMVDITRVGKFIENLNDEQQIKLRVTAKDAYNGVRYDDLEFIVHDKKEAQNSSDYLLFFFPFSTTLVQIVLDRKVDDTVLCLGDFSRG